MAAHWTKSSERNCRPHPTHSDKTAAHRIKVNCIGRKKITIKENHFSVSSFFFKKKKKKKKKFRMYIYLAESLTFSFYFPSLNQFTSLKNVRTRK